MAKRKSSVIETITFLFSKNEIVLTFCQVGVLFFASFFIIYSDIRKLVLDKYLKNELVAQI